MSKFKEINIDCFGEINIDYLNTALDFLIYDDNPLNFITLLNCSVRDLNRIYRVHKYGWIEMYDRKKDKTTFCWSGCFFYKDYKFIYYEDYDNIIIERIVYI